MPRAKRRCAQPGCKEFHPCKTHPWGWRGAKTEGTLPSDWKSRVKAVKSRSGGMCEKRENFLGKIQRCKQPGQSVDHITNRAEWPRGKSGLHSLDNLQHLCNFHHDMKTRMESQRGLLRRFKKT